jgi:hypothetical protein
LVATQRSDDRTLPAEIRDRFGMRACLHVGNEVTNDMILGKPAFADGGRATDLRYNIDRGTCVVNHGFATTTKYTIVRIHYVRAHDPETHTPDQITPIITRALHHMTATGRTMRAAPDNITDEPPPPDHLTDIHTVLHDQPRFRTQIVLTRLAGLKPAVYEGWSFTDLKTALAHHGVAISKSHGNSIIRTHDTTHALTHRNTNGAAMRGTNRGTGEVFPQPPQPHFPPPSSKNHPRGSTTTRPNSRPKPRKRRLPPNERTPPTLAEHIQAIVDSFPPLTPEQRDRIATLLRTPGNRQTNPPVQLKRRKPFHRDKPQ